MANKNCMEEEEKQQECNPLYPMTTTDKVIDSTTGETLTERLHQINHLYLPFTNNTRQDTRLLVPETLRRKGLWITYVSCKGEVITEWYKEEATDNAHWRNGDNWVPYINKEFVMTVLEDLLSWYKA